MAKTDWQSRYRAWFDWYKSGGGPYFNGGGGNPDYDYYLKNYNYASQPSYNHDGATMLTLSEGQSYGMLYALMGDNLKAFLGCYHALEVNHVLTRTNISAGKDALINGTVAWPEGYADFMDNTGKFILEDKGANASLKTFGWVWSANYSEDGTPHEGLSSIYMAPDGDLVAAACLLLAYERWNVTAWLTAAQGILTDFADYGVRKCGTRYALTMGQYRGGGGFTLPYPIGINFNAGNVFPGTPGAIIADYADYTTGDAVRFFAEAGAVMPSPLVAQDSLGEVWPKYFVRVNDPFNCSFFPTKADAIADTNAINIATTGSGNATIYPYETQAGQIGTNPSYLFPPFFKLFAKYDTVNAALWTDLVTNTYVDIEHGCGLNYWNMPPYLDGVNISDGTNALFRAGGDSAASSPDAFRVALNMAFDKSDDALDVLKTQCQLNGTTLLWEPKAGASGGIWRYYVDTGFLPFTMGATAEITSIDGTTFNATTDAVDLLVDFLSDNSTYSNPTAFTAGTLPTGIVATDFYYPRKTTGSLYTLHTTLAGALANTGKVDITTSTTGTVVYVVGLTLPSTNVNTTNDTIALTGSTFYMKTGDAVRLVKEVGGTIPAGITAGTTYYIRLSSLRLATLHASSAGAIANTGKVDITTAGSGNFMLTCTVAPVGWYYRGGISDVDPMSPYGASQVLAYKYALNGYADAETFYNSLPDWIKQGNDGSFVESNGDYYTQHSMGWICGIMSDRPRVALYSRNYLVFDSDEQADANSLQTSLASALNNPRYATVLKDAVSGKYAVPVMGVNAWDALTPDQQTDAVKLLPSGAWRANL